MKKPTINLKSFNPFTYKKYLPVISFIVLLAFLNLVYGCVYYKSKPQRVISTTENPELYEKIKSTNKYVIVHLGNKAYHLKNIQLNTDLQEFSGITESVPPNHSNYYNSDPGTHRIRSQSGYPASEIHIYISQYIEGTNSEIKIPISSITKIDVYDRNSVATVFAVLGGVVAALVLVFIIIILTKSSCPFVYTSDGTAFHFTGEMYGGAIYSSLERDDYMPLPVIGNDSGNYKIKISNELLERQYTNLAELMIVDHPENSSVIIDKNGSVQTIAQPVQVVSAMSDNNIDYKSLLLSRDFNSFLFNDEYPNSEGLNSLILTFPNTHQSEKGKLILNTKNSYWLDYVYGKFTGEFGTYYNTFAEKQKNVPAEKNIKWSLDQSIPLSVYLETENGWEFVDYFNLIGPLAARDVVMPIDLLKNRNEYVRIKLECGFMFWDIDYAAMDFTENIHTEIKQLSPNEAIDENGVNVSDQLTKNDNSYLVQPEVGNEVFIKYPAPSLTQNKKRTVFLHSRGYYEYIRDFKNKPDYFYLNSFKKKKAFTKYAKKHFDEFVGQKAYLVNALN